MKKIIPIIIFIFAISIYAQTDTAKVETWTGSGTAGLNINQVAFSDWSQGGDNTFAWTIFGNFSASYNSEPWNLKNSLKIAYGRTKLGNADFRTNDNELYLESVLSYDVGWLVDPYFSNTVRTSVSNGYDYKVTPTVQTAAFFDPGYVTQSLGFSYNKSKIVTTRLGLALQETFTNKFRQYSDDPDTQNKIEAFKLDTGLESVTEANLNLDTNILFNSKLRLFTRFNSLDVWDVRWDNTITAKVNSYLNVNLNVLVIYQKDQSPKTQLKEGLQLGLTYTLF